MKDDWKKSKEDDKKKSKEYNFVVHPYDTNGNPDKTKDSDKWLHFLDSHNLSDCFRKLYEHDKAFTKVTNGRITRRIDRIYFTSKVIDYVHIPVGFSDHCFSPGVRVHGSNHVSWGRGSWKINNTLFSDHNIVTASHIWSTNQFSHDQVNDFNMALLWDFNLESLGKGD